MSALASVPAQADADGGRVAPQGYKAKKANLHRLLESIKTADFYRNYNRPSRINWISVGRLGTVYPTTYKRLF